MPIESVHGLLEAVGKSVRVPGPRLKHVRFHRSHDQDTDACLDQFPVLFVAIFKKTGQLVHGFLGDASVRAPPSLSAPFVNERPPKGLQRKRSKCFQIRQRHVCGRGNPIAQYMAGVQA